MGEHIKTLNWNYNLSLHDAGVDVFDARAEFEDEHTIRLTDEDGVVTMKTADKILVAVGGRPRFPNK